MGTQVAEKLRKRTNLFGIVIRMHTDETALDRPSVYWFWNNGKITKAGITSDLEAMKRVGIGGVIIMDVVERFVRRRRARRIS